MASLYLARASVEMTSAMEWIRLVSQVAARPMACGKDGGVAGTSDAVESFIPPIVGGDLEARDGGGDVLHLGDFFFDGEAGDKIGDALVDGERGIEVGRSGGGCCGSIGQRRGLGKARDRGTEILGFAWLLGDCGKARREVKEQEEGERTI